MNPKLKLTAYAVLLILCAWFGWGFYSNYSAVAKAAADTGANTHTNETSTTNAPTNSATAPNTNAPATPGTNLTSTPDTNAPPAQTNAPPPSPKAAQTPVAVPDEGSRRSAMTAYLAAFVGAVIGLGLLIASDVTHFVGSQAVEFLFNDAGDGMRDPDYERAEAEWANGKYLDAIQLMRDFLKKQPRELYAALRIAEIYEKDLRNYLAAALEYEEVLKHRLPAERWGWAAVHLCNLYSKLNKSDKALALLHRIVEDYPKTSAAKKARARLGIAEPEAEEAEEEASPEGTPELSGEQTIIYMEERPPELEPRRAFPVPPPEPPKSPEPPKPSLPPGFRPKQ